MDLVSIQDTPTHRTRFHEMTEEQQIAYLDSIRDKRLAALRIYEAHKAEKKAVLDQKLSIKAGKLLQRMSKIADELDSKMAKLEELMQDHGKLRMLMESEQ